MQKVLLLSLLFLATSFIRPTKNEPLAITVTNLKNTQAPFMVAVFRKEDPFTKKAFKNYTLEPKGASSPTLYINDLPYGEYAIAIFQDLNKDGQLNTNVIGIPKEPYCFSNNYRPRVKAPKYESCKFIYSDKKNHLYLQLI